MCKLLKTYTTPNLTVWWKGLTKLGRLCCLPTSMNTIKIWIHSCHIWWWLTDQLYTTQQVVPQISLRNSATSMGKRTTGGACKTSWEGETFRQNKYHGQRVNWKIFQKAGMYNILHRYSDCTYLLNCGRCGKLQVKHVDRMGLCKEQMLRSYWSRWY